MQENRKIIQIMAPNRIMDAVYREEDGSITRTPIPLLALVEVVFIHEGFDGQGNIEPREITTDIIPITYMEGDKSFDHESENALTVSNFLGIEYDGIKKEWGKK